MVASYTQLLAGATGQIGPGCRRVIAFAVDGAKRMQNLITTCWHIRAWGRRAVIAVTDAEVALASAVVNVRRPSKTVAR